MSTITFENERVKRAAQKIVAEQYGIKKRWWETHYSFCRRVKDHIGTKILLVTREIEQITREIEQNEILLKKINDEIAELRAQKEKLKENEK